MFIPKEDQVTVDMLQDRSGAILYGKDTVEDVCTDGLTLYAEYTINGIKYPALLPPVSPGYYSLNLDLNF